MSNILDNDNDIIDDESDDNHEEIENIENRILEDHVLTDNDDERLRRETEQALLASLDNTLPVLPEIGFSRRVPYKDNLIKYNEERMKTMTTPKDMSEMPLQLRKTCFI